MEIVERILQITTIPTQAPVYLQATGLFLHRYGLAAMMLLFGLQKWTKAEAEGIQPWVSHSPPMSWPYHVPSVQGASAEKTHGTFYPTLGRCCEERVCHTDLSVPIQLTSLKPVSGLCSVCPRS